MEVLKSATTPNCVTWTPSYGMTSLTQAESLSQYLILQATCLLVSINLPKRNVLPHFREKNQQFDFCVVGFRSTNSCMQGHRTFFQGKFFLTGILCNFSLWFAASHVAQRSFSCFHTVPYVCFSLKTATQLRIMCNHLFSRNLLFKDFK